MDQIFARSHSAGGMFAIRLGDVKLVLGNGSGGRQAPQGKPFQKPYQRFNLREDIAESNDLIETNPQAAEQLEGVLQKIRDSEGSDQQ